jgi:hypothetical protein
MYDAKRVIRDHPIISVAIAAAAGYVANVYIIPDLKLRVTGPHDLYKPSHSLKF